MKPYRIFLFFVYILLSVSVLTVLCDGWTLSYGNQTLFRFPALSKPLASVETGDPAQRHARLSEAEMMRLYKMDSTLLFPDQLAGDSLFLMEAPADSVFPLDAFFEALETDTQQSGPVRIVHYGDSQIEGDRITSTVRHFLQKAFGGTGPGMIPLHSFVKTGAFTFQYDERLQSTNILKSPLNRKVGAWMGYLSSMSGGRIRLDRSSFYAYREAQKFSRISWFTNHSNFSTQLQIGTRSYTGPIAIQTGTYGRRYSVDLDSCYASLTLQFNAANGLHLYGLALDGDRGITMDNLPLRGSSGYLFVDRSGELLAEQFRMSRTRLIVLQFGVNAVSSDPYKPMPNIKAYEQRFYEELAYLRRWVPEIPVVVIGVSDRAVKLPEGMVSNPNAALVRSAQKRAAKRAGCMFWDLYQAMGGQGAMLEWAQNGLAAKDFIHFSPRGAEKVGHLFYKSLIWSYLDFKYRQKLAEFQELQSVQVHAKS